VTDRSASRPAGAFFFSPLSAWRMDPLHPSTSFPVCAQGWRLNTHGVGLIALFPRPSPPFFAVVPFERSNGSSPSPKVPLSFALPRFIAFFHSVTVPEVSLYPFLTRDRPICILSPHGIQDSLPPQFSELNLSRVFFGFLGP